MPWTKRGKRDELLRELQAALAQKDAAASRALLRRLVENHRGDLHITGPVTRAIDRLAEEDPAGAVTLIHDLLNLSPPKELIKAFISRAMALSGSLAETDLGSAVEAAWTGGLWAQSYDWNAWQTAAGTLADFANKALANKDTKLAATAADLADTLVYISNPANCKKVALALIAVATALIKDGELEKAENFAERAIRGSAYLGKAEQAPIWQAAGETLSMLADSLKEANKIETAVKAARNAASCLQEGPLKYETRTRVPGLISEFLQQSLRQKDGAAFGRASEAAQNWIRAERAIALQQPTSSPGI